MALFLSPKNFSYLEMTCNCWCGSYSDKAPAMYQLGPEAL
uniref:Uncharacterized protein n=1 Tax=Rhizophora mucronata TaxID=61149 RepID=A0A2P2IRB2_RHIMU